MKTRLKVLRAEKNLTQAQLAKALGTNQPTVSAWERGDNIPRAPMMQKIADYFGVKKEDIFLTAFHYSKQLKVTKVSFLTVNSKEK